jgi:hypothetical protein
LTEEEQLNLAIAASIEDAIPAQSEETSSGESN